MMQDLHNNIKVERSISPHQVSDNTAAVGEIHDLANVGAFEWAIGIGTLADADATFTVLVEDGDNSALSDNAAVADAFLLGTEAGASFIFSDDDQVRKIGYIGPKRYVRMTITPAANTGASDISAVGIKGHLRKPPVTSQS